MTELPSCQVVVVTHDSDATIADCIAAALAQEEVALDLVIVDNGSRNDPASLVISSARHVWIRNPHNPGFAVACNQGAAVGAAPWLLFLNPDCILPPQALIQLIRVAEGRLGDGLLGAQLLEADGRLQPASRRLAPTPARLLSGRITLPEPAWREHPERAPDFEALEAISGALMLIPRRLFEALQGFDEGYRLHVEDLDLCRRVRERGDWVGIAPRVRVRHLKGTSSRKRPVWVEWHKHRGMLRYFRKFDRASTSPWLSGLLLTGLLIRFPLAALRAAWRARGTPGMGNS